MGLRVSNLVSTDCDSQEMNIPEELLLDILSFVPASDLLKSCRLVCKQWREIINAQSLWKIKCERENKLIPPFRLEELPNNFYRTIYLHDPYGKNLIKNPCGQDGLNEWIIVCNNGDGFLVENPPKGSDPLPSELRIQYCFATSFGECTKRQVIDLIKEGIHEKILDSDFAVIHVGEWYAARFDCSCIYKLKVFLLDENLDLLKEFTFSWREEQWVGKEWHKVNHTFENVKGVRYVRYDHSGQDDQFWAGHYGSKMTGSYVKVGFK